MLQQGTSRAGLTALQLKVKERLIEALIIVMAVSVLARVVVNLLPGPVLYSVAILTFLVWILQRVIRGPHAGR